MFGRRIAQPKKKFVSPGRSVGGKDSLIPRSGPRDDERKIVPEGTKSVCNGGLAGMRCREFDENEGQRGGGGRGCFERTQSVKCAVFK